MSDFEHRWHVALNDFNRIRPDGFAHWMYEAKRMSQELKRLPALFKKERLGELSKIFQYCSFSAKEEIAENFLSCCLGKRCTECQYLKAIDVETMTPEERDESKAYTCVSHILHTIGSGQHIDTSEGYILTEDDRIFWQRTYESMSNYDAKIE